MYYKSYNNINNITKILNNINNITKIFNNINNITKIFNNINNITKIFNNINNITKILNNINNITKIFNNTRWCWDMWFELQTRLSSILININYRSERQSSVFLWQYFDIILKKWWQIFTSEPWGTSAVKSHNCDNESFNTTLWIKPDRKLYETIYM
jgi:hypothetical protein